MEEHRTRILVNGFGRIGRAIFRLLSTSNTLEIAAINDPLPASQLAYLLKYDSVMNRFFSEVVADGEDLVWAGRRIPVSHAVSIGKAEIRGNEISLVVNSSGRNNTRGQLEQLLGAGASRVIVSKPLNAGVCDRTIMMGVNNTDLRTSDRIVSGGSCTAHCYTPLIKLLAQKWTIQRGYMMTLHAYTSGQNLVDGGHEADIRRGRAAAHNIVPTSTESLVAFEQVMPEMRGRIVGMAQRVPVIDGSNVELILELDKDTSADELNGFVRQGAEQRFAHIIEYCTDPIVSGDVIGNPHSCVHDSLLTHAQGNLVRLIAWYDNEWGYANRLAELLELCAARGVVGL